MIKKEIGEFCEGIFQFLSKSIDEDGKFGARSFYGETFTALSMFLWDKSKYKNDIKKLLNGYVEKDKNEENFHWEFNNYALYNIYNIEKYENIKELLFPLTFKGTKCTNWTILRSIVQLYDGDQTSLNEIDKKIEYFQMENGLIKDDSDVNSFQYHCFIISLIYEVYTITGLDKYKESFFKGVDFINRMMLENGCSIYVGRGQEQLFGYGPLIYVYEKAYQISHDLRYKKSQRKCFEYLISFKNKDNVVPLVLNKSEVGFPKVIDINNEKYLGWYAYNNYYDYLPFLLYFLVKTYNEYEVCGDDLKEKKHVGENYVDEMYAVIRKEKYTAAVASGGGYLTNDLPIPIIVSRGEIITPCYGGEQFNSNLYNDEYIALPYIKTKLFNIGMKNKMKNCIKFLLRRSVNNNYFFRQALKYKLNEDGQNSIIMLGENKQIKHSRKFTFLESEIKIEDTIIAKQKINFENFVFFNLLFFNLKEIDKNNYIIHKYANLKIEQINMNELYINKNEYGYCALGKLKRLQIGLDNSYITPGKIINSKYSIVLNGAEK